MTFLLLTKHIRREFNQRLTVILSSCWTCPPTQQCFINLHTLKLHRNSYITWGWGNEVNIVWCQSLTLSFCNAIFHPVLWKGSFFFFFCGADTQLCNLCWLFSTFSPTDNCTESSNVLKQELMDAGSIWIIGFGHLQIKICDWWEGTMVSQQLYIWWYKIQRSQ